MGETTRTNTRTTVRTPRTASQPITRPGRGQPRSTCQRQAHEQHLTGPVPHTPRPTRPPHPKRHFPGRSLLALLSLVLLLSACGDDDNDSPTDTTSTSMGDTSTSMEAPGIEQPAIWPAPDVLFATPEEAAQDFVSTVLGVPPVLGEFQQGDSRSGEIEVFSPSEDGTTRIFRGLLLLRRLGIDDGWFILGAVNDNASIISPASMAEVPAGLLTVEESARGFEGTVVVTAFNDNASIISPASMAEVPAGLLTVQGSARGFEGTVVVTAFIAGDAETQIDQEITQGGAFETPEPFTVTLDLTGTSPGDVVTLLVRGGTGLDTDPGEFGAIPILITG